MKELNQPLSEIYEMPIPLALELMKVGKEEGEKMEKEMKKSKRGKGGR